MEGLPKILIVGQSRVVRAALAKHLHDNYAIREESNGEAAWESLILDSSIVAVIAEANLPKLDAFALIERMHARKLQRLVHTPLLLIVSGTDSPEERARAKARGVSGFIARTMQRGEVLATIRQVLHKEEGRNDLHAHQDDHELRSSDVLGQVACLSQGDGEPVETRVIQGPKRLRNGAERLLSREAILESTAKTLRCRNCSPKRSSVLLLGLDTYAAVAQRHGAEVAAKIESQLVSLLIGRLGKCDFIGTYAPGKLAVVSCGTALAQCRKFGDRVVDALARAHVTVRGVKLSLGISVGIANSPEDGAEISVEEMFALAKYRQDRAAASGGNAVVAEGRPELGAATEEAAAAETIEIVAPDEAEASLIAPGTFPLRRHEDLFDTEVLPGMDASKALQGKEILPLLKMIDQEFDLKLPLDKVAKGLESSH